jgi:nardilysin
MERAYRNSNLEPLDHSANLRLHILYERSWELEEQLSTLQNLTLSDLLDFRPNLLSQVLKSYFLLPYVY